MKQDPSMTFPALFDADELPDDGKYLRKPMTTEEYVPILHLWESEVRSAELRSNFLGEISDVRIETINRLQESLLRLREGLKWQYTSSTPGSTVSRQTTSA